MKTPYSEYLRIKKNNKNSKKKRDRQKAKEEKERLKSIRIDLGRDL